LVAEVAVIDREAKSDFTPFDRRLVAALLLASGAWFAHLCLSDALMPESCVDGTKLILHVMTLVCLLGAAIASWIAWLARSRAAGESARWNATVTLVLSIAFALVSVAQEIPNLLLRSCD
jgi:hypothetical protein